MNPVSTWKAALHQHDIWIKQVDELLSDSYTGQPPNPPEAKPTTPTSSLKKPAVPEKKQPAPPRTSPRKLETKTEPKKAEPKKPEPKVEKKPVAPAKPTTPTTTGKRSAEQDITSSKPPKIQKLVAGAKYVICCSNIDNEKRVPSSFSFFFLVTFIYLFPDTSTPPRLLLPFFSFFF